jgi:hypothetical protein
VHDNLCRLGSTCSTWSTSGLPPGSTTAWWLRVSTALEGWTVTALEK